MATNAREARETYLTVGAVTFFWFRHCKPQANGLAFVAWFSASLPKPQDTYRHNCNGQHGNPLMTQRVHSDSDSSSRHRDLLEDGLDHFANRQSFDLELGPEDE